MPEDTLIFGQLLFWYYPGFNWKTKNLTRIIQHHLQWFLQNMKFVGSIKMQKSKYLENEALIFLQIKKLFYYASKAILWQKVLLAYRPHNTTHRPHIPISVVSHFGRIHTIRIWVLRRIKSWLVLIEVCDIWNFWQLSWIEIKQNPFLFVNGSPKQISHHNHWFH